MTVARRVWIGVMIVMPTLSGRQQSDQRIVPAVIVCGVVAVTPHMGERVYRPCRVPHHDGPQRATPEEKAGAEPQGFGKGFMSQQCNAAKKASALS